MLPEAGSIQFITRQFIQARWITSEGGGAWWGAGGVKFWNFQWRVNARGWWSVAGGG